MTYLYVGNAKVGNGADLGTGHSRSFEGQHRLEQTLELRYGRRHSYRSLGTKPGNRRTI